ncbi:MAG: hypothetical protein WBQ26_09280 [Gemmatimonadaceae bacterium]
MRDDPGDPRGTTNGGRDTGPSISLGQLREAVTRGVISAEQLRMIRELPEPGDERAGGTAREVRRGLNAVTIAYYMGAAAVVFAFGWFIIDRWKPLGAGGVLVVSLVYALVFGITSRTLTRFGFATAAALAALLTVVMMPLVAWALLSLAGWWYEPRIAPGMAPFAAWTDVLESLRWIPLELTAALAALIALRRVQFAVLAIPVAMALPLVVVHAMPLLLDPEIVSEMTAWGLLVAAAAVIAAGYVADRRTSDGEDYARWVYLTGLITLAVGVLSAWEYAGYLRHALPMLAVALFALALYLRRSIFLVFGGLGFVGYLAYLAFDVFGKAMSFPVLLATFGTGIILITVLLQRRYPSLARQVEAQQHGRRRVPHAPLVFGAAMVVLLGVFAGRLDGARDRARAQWTRIRATQLEMHKRRKMLTPGPASRPAARDRN